MSIWGFIAFQTMTAVLGTEHCQMQGLNLNFPQITAIAMSQDGSITFAKTSAADVGAIAHRVFIARGDRFQSWNVVTSNPATWQFVDNSGRIYGNTGVRLSVNTPTIIAKGTALRGVTFDGSVVRHLPDGGEGDAFPGGFSIQGVGRNEVLGMTMTTPMVERRTFFLYQSVAWQQGGSRVLWESEHPCPVIAPCGDGYLGSAAAPNGTIIRTSVLRGNTVEPLAMPPRVSHLEPLACSLDGSVITGTGSPGTSRNGVCILWVNRVPRVFSIGRGQLSDARLVAVSENGAIAVGSIGEKRGANAFVWTPESGLQSLVDFARGRKIVMPYGWRLLNAVGVSPDGDTIYGTALDWRGRERPYLFKISDSKKEEK